jgi:hypothetical protein
MYSVVDRARTKGISFCMKWFLIPFLLMGSCSQNQIIQHSPQAIVWNLDHSSESEAYVLHVLKELLSSHRLETYYFASRVEISDQPEQKIGTVVISTKFKDQPELLLNVFLLQQIRFFLNQNKRQVKRATLVLAELYPALPLGAPEGQKTADENYFSLIAGLLEFRAMRNLIGENNAKAVILRRGELTGLYQTLFTNETAIQRVVETHNLLPEE